MAISAQDVKQLREKTGAGMMDCKKALTEADGNLDEAVKILRTKGLAAAAKKAHRAASEGAVVVVGDSSKMTILELNCETDFVARNPEFQEFAAALAQQAHDSGVDDVEALKTQPFSGDASHTVEQMISQKVATIGENIVLNRAKILAAENGNTLSSYIHGGGKIGVVVEGTSAVSEEALHDVALHVAATDPRFALRSEVTQEMLDTEKEIALKQAIEQGKPEHIAEKMVAGKMEKFYEMEVLSEQAFAKDPSKSVGQYLKESSGADAAVVRFVRFQLGQS